MSHYSSYIKEIDDTETIEDDKGFATYKFVGNEECYIKDIYVKPEYRKENIAAGYADQIAIIAKEKGCKTLVGSVNTNIKDPTSSMKVLLAYGMKFHSISGFMLYFIKEL